MKKQISIISTILIGMFIFVGCWNYSDVNEMRFVAGAAIDYNQENNNYVITSELINIATGQKEMSGELFQSKGRTIFDAVRDLIMKSGRRLYWAHAKIIIINKDIAEKGMIPAIDMIYRDAEMRGDMTLLISEDKTAREILEAEMEKLHMVHSFHIDDSMENEDSISKYHKVTVWRFIKDIYEEGISPTLPLIKLMKHGDIIVPEAGGTGVFKGDKLVGTLDEHETKSFLFVIDELKGGVLVLEPSKNNKSYKVALEILSNQTKAKPVFLNEKLTMKIDVNTNANIGEIGGEGNFIDDEGLEILKKEGEEVIKRDINEIIKKVQTEYHSDIFKFATIIKAEMPEVWKEIRDDWDEVFTNLNVEITVNLKIKGSAMANKHIKVEK